MIDYFFQPKSFEAKDLAKVGIKVIDREARKCLCVICGEEWIVEDVACGNTPNFWQCPIGCNILSLQIRAAGPNWALWELSDGTTFVGTLKKDGNVEVFDIEPTKEEQYNIFSDFIAEGGDALAVGLDWDIHEFTDGTVLISQNYSDDIYTLKTASQRTKLLHERGKENQYSVAGDLGMHT